MTLSSFIAFRKPGRGPQPWFRRVFYQDWSLKLLALAITMTLWFVIAGHEPQIERELTVEPRVGGTPAAGHEVKEIFAIPNKVRVRGPAGHVNALQRASTETISIDGRRDSFDVPQTPTYVSDSNVELLDKVVDVHVRISPLGNSQAKSRDTN